jgi:sugar phosphate isomerase/epimerase
MYLSLNRSLTHKLEWPEFAALAARVGYGGVDVSLWPARADGAVATVRLLERLKIKPGVLPLPVRLGVAASAVFSQELSELPESAKFASDIGCNRMTAILPPSSDIPKLEFHKIAKERTVAIADVLDKSGVRLGLEFLSPLHLRTSKKYEFIWRMDEALAFCLECGSNVGLTLDAWHWHHAQATGADIRHAGKSRIVHVHVSDARPQAPEDVRDDERVLPGEGVIDLIAFFTALGQIGYADAVSPEPMGRIPMEMTAEEGARRGLDATLAVMKTAGVI